jgi:Ca2+-transporting ATPase
MEEFSKLSLGLTSSDVLERRLKFGFNELSTAKPRSAFKMAIDTVKEPMFLLLLACCILYLALGDLGEALLLSAAIFFVILITFVQERRTEKTLDALRDLSSPRALVMRDGVKIRIPGKDVVPGDLVYVVEGDRIPADGVVVESNALKLDESLLTGESVSVRKQEIQDYQQPVSLGGEDTGFVFSGTLVVQGGGKVLVTSIGSATELGKIGTDIRKTTRPSSRLQEETRAVVKVFALFSLLLSVVIAALWWLRDGDILKSVLMGLTFAMGTIPEEFPVVLTVFLALGAWRISKHRVLTRRMSALESLGSATFLCVDKTGTLTENKMKQVAVWSPEGTELRLDQTTVSLDAFSPQEKVIIKAAAKASDQKGADPMDRASLLTAKKFALWSSEDDVGVQKDYPLVRPLLAVGFGWQDGKDKNKTVFVKGAPESILQLCKVSLAEQEGIHRAFEKMAAQGLRVLGVARSTPIEGPFYETLSQYRYEFLGLVGYRDPVKSGAQSAVGVCNTAGLKVMMITGDYPTTASSVAREIGLENADDVLTGAELTQMDDESLRQKLKHVRVLARMVPEHKLRVVEVLKSLGEVVAMTGDGVNDAPALKAAHIGVAMGERGTDVAREAADLVLLDDDFKSIVDAIRLGRRIYSNIEKAVTYIIAIHVPIIGLSLAPLIFGTPSILWPVHIAFLELIIDPVCSIAFEAESEEPTLMSRNPRPRSEKLFNARTLFSGLFEGAAILAAVYAAYVFVGARGEGPEHARAVAFTTLVFANLCLILMLRSKTEPIWVSLRRKNPTLVWIFSAIALISAAVLYIPKLAQIFRFSPPHWDDLLLCTVVAAGSMIGFEVLKSLRWRRQVV